MPRLSPEQPDNALVSRFVCRHRMRVLGGAAGAVALSRAGAAASAADRLALRRARRLLRLHPERQQQ
ncbi:hypothetical protein KBP30_39755 [Streptomyces sp. Go40/10]|uniref:hypothetical protein n=1 Tax=Streptomyces sp. Go40/10 TaxID=2825844 RepID=UPI001E40A039|nr:hypothetical protein [Streptomyces sp. Go40/10]UFR06932.1 hypothetical protein KBP30_39755 [Streptomyces sp. Go40/10]